MTLLGTALKARNAYNPAENPDNPLDGETLMRVLGMDYGTHAGKRVNEITALGMSAVWRAVHLTSSVPASLPFKAYKAGSNGLPEPASGQGANLMAKPHPDLTPFELWQVVYVHRRLWGNAYLRKLRNQLGVVVELWPIAPARVKVGRESETGRKVYAIDGGLEVLSDDEILHLPGMGYDMICGVSPIRAARQSIGLGLAAEEYGAKLFGNGSLATGILQTEQRLTQRQADQLAQRWKDKAGDLGNAHGTVVLDKGATFQQLTIAPEDAQFLESRRFQITEVCRWFGIPPFLMFETEKSTSWGTGLEQQALGWVKFDLNPDLVSVEQRVSSILAPGPVYAHYSLDGLLRGDSKARALFYRVMWELGVYSTNEIRAYEELEPVEGGDTRYRSLNMGQLGTTDSAEHAPSSVPSNRYSPPMPDLDRLILPEPSKELDYAA